MIHDVAICGGGMAGLTLALQLRGRLPDASIVLLEPMRRPLPEACFKVGESTVEIGGHYLGSVVGCHDYLIDRHLRKNGLRFFSGAPGSAIVERSEMGPRESPSLPAYQIDRGRFENDLRARCLDEKIDLREGFGVRDVELGEPHKLIAVETRSENKDAVEVQARWLIDATGRRRLLARKLKLSLPIADQASAAWFRLTDRVRIDELVPRSEAAWHGRDLDDNRWLSTVHLCGEGYWLWMIALKTGHTSIGVVAEAASHDYRTYSTPDAFRGWLGKHEPALAERIAELEFADFITMKDFRYSASRVISADRWASVGEAGIFIDPLYSPGADFIGLANTFVAELIDDDLAGKLDPKRVDSFDAFFRDWSKLIERTTVLGSQAFGAPEVLGAKLHWDFFYYWAFMCPYYFSKCFESDPDEHSRFHDMLKRYTALNERAQRVFSAWAKIAPQEPVEPFVGLPEIATTLSDLHLALLEERGRDATYASMESALAWGDEIVTELMLRALRRAGPSGAAELLKVIDVAWDVPESRLAADEVPANRRRKLLGKAVRDMERSIGKNAPATADAPRLRELLETARVGLAR